MCDSATKYKKVIKTFLQRKDQRVKPKRQSEPL
ncbi:hypothetical protein BN439_3873 [Erwinia amylovora Ea644]|nr:hypothetical protein BN439_3873 [Erwinia amylovora Ea644]CCP08975.1 hypothetical protein BN440_3991 [Erwinia amylovora MR1]